MRFFSILFASLFVFSTTKSQLPICINDLYPQLADDVKNGSYGDPDSNTVKSQWKLWHQFVYSKPDSAFFHAQKALEISIHTKYKRGLGGSILRMGNARQYAGRYKEAEDHILCAIDLEEQFGTPRSQAIALSDLGIVLYNTNRYDEALNYLKQSVLLSQKNKLPRQEAQALQNMARVYNVKGFHKLAITKNLASLKIFENEGHKGMIASGYNTLGITYIYADEFRKAIKNFLKSAELSNEIGESDDRFQAESLSNIGFCYNELNMFDSSFYYYNLGENLARKSGDIYSVLMSNAGMAQALTALERPREAIDLLHRNFVAFDTLRDNFYQTSTKINWAKAKIKLNSFTEAKAIINELDRQDPPITGKTRIKFLAAKHALQLKTHNISGALLTFKEMTHLKDSMNHETKVTELEELQLIYNLEKKDSEIQVLHERQLKDLWRVRALWLVLIASVLLGILGIMLQRRWAKLRRMRDAEKMKVIEAEKRKLTGEVHAKDRELTAQSVINANQQEELQKLRHSLHELSNRQHINAHDFNKLIRQIDRQLDKDQGWEQVLTTFKEVQPGFMDDLILEFPKLTSNELRLAALMRMKIDSKTIARLTNITPASVKRARNRFRQKVNVEVDERLQDWINRRQN